MMRNTNIILNVTSGSEKHIVAHESTTSAQIKINFREYLSAITPERKEPIICPTIVARPTYPPKYVSRSLSLNPKSRAIRDKEGLKPLRGVDKNTADKHKQVNATPAILFC
jgi:hypothetical protein